MEEGGAPKFFRKPTKTLQKSTRRDFLPRNTLGNRRRDPTTRSKPPAQRRRPTAINGVKLQENLGADKKTRTSETRAVPNVRRAPTNAANRRRTKSRTRNENSITGQQQVRNQICCQNFFNESPPACQQSLVPPRPETRGRPVGKSSRRKASATDEVRRARFDQFNRNIGRRTNSTELY